MTRPPGRRGGGGRGPTRRGRKVRGAPAKKSCPLSVISVPVGLARGVLVAWQVREMSARARVAVPG